MPLDSYGSAALRDELLRLALACGVLNGDGSLRGHLPSHSRLAHRNLIGPIGGSAADLGLDGACSISLAVPYTVFPRSPAPEILPEIVYACDPRVALLSGRTGAGLLGQEHPEMEDVIHGFLRVEISGWGLQLSGGFVCMALPLLRHVQADFILGLQAAQAASVLEARLAAEARGRYDRYGGAGGAGRHLL